MCKEIHEGNRILLNPGSVGMPLQSDGKSQFLILLGENVQWKHEFIDLEYDIEAVIKELQEEKKNVWVYKQIWRV